MSGVHEPERKARKNEVKRKQEPENVPSHQLEAIEINKFTHTQTPNQICRWKKDGKMPDNLCTSMAIDSNVFIWFMVQFV